MVKKSYRYILLSTLILGASMGAGTNVFATDPEVDLSVTVNPSLTLSVSSNSVNLPITPDADGEYNTTNFTITSATNNMYGYTLTMSTEDDHTYLESTTVNPTTGTKPQIQSLASSQDGISAATFEAATAEANGLNRWGIAIGSGNYNAVTSPKEVKKTTTNNASGVDNTTVNIAAKLNLAVPAGVYKNKFIIQMVVNPLPGGLEEAYQNAGKSKTIINGKEYYAMQDMTPTICNNASLTGDVIEVYDTRDNTIYHIGKLADERCWLLDNLALDLTDSTVLSSLTADNTNADTTALSYLKGTTTRDPETDPDGNYATAGVANWRSRWYSYTEPYIYTTSKDITSLDELDVANTWKIGIYYDFCAASAGSYCYRAGISIDKPDTAIDAEHDICPSGWRMPTSYSYNTTGPDGGEYQTLYDSYSGASGTGEGSTYAYYRNALHLPFSGIYGFQSGVGYGDVGTFWSSTYTSHSTVQMLSLTIRNPDVYSDSGIFTQSYADRGTTGFSVRCIAKTGTE